MISRIRPRLLLALTLLLAACGGSTVVVSGGEVVPQQPTAAESSTDPGEESTSESSPDTGEAVEQSADLGENGFAAQSLRASAATTLASDSYRFEMFFSMFIADGEMEIDISSDRPLAIGAVSGSTQQISMDLGTIFDDMLPALVVEGSAVEGSAAELDAMFGGDLSMEVITNSTTMYVRAPFLAGLVDAIPVGEVPPGFAGLEELASGWAVIDLTLLGDFAPGDISSLSGAPAGGSPAELLEMLQDAGAEVSELGRETIRGVETTHLRAVVDLLTLLEAQGATDTDLGAINLSGLDLKLPFDIFVDDESRVRRLFMELSLADIAALAPDEPIPPGSEFRFSTTIDLFDFGTEIQIDLPDDSEIVGDFTDLFGELASLGS